MLQGIEHLGLSFMLNILTGEHLEGIKQWGQLSILLFLVFKKIISITGGAFLITF